MMVLYSGTTDPYSHRCRFVLFEKGMDFEIRDVDLFAKPEDIALMNPYNEVPILVERDLILYESHIINEYIDERFPHPQLMPGDPVARARVRLFLFNFEKELFANVNILEGRGEEEPGVDPVAPLGRQEGCAVLWRDGGYDRGQVRCPSRSNHHQVIINDLITAGVGAVLTVKIKHDISTQADKRCRRTVRARVKNVRSRSVHESPIPKHCVVVVLIKYPAADGDVSVNHCEHEG